MSEQIRRWGIATDISTALFKAEKRRLQKRIDTIDEDNRKLSQSMHYGFMHKGKNYNPSTSPTTNEQRNYPVLHENLHSEMEDYLEDVKRVGYEKSRMYQILVKVFAECKTHQELRDSIPDFLVDMVPELKGYSRYNPEEIHIQHLPQVLRYYRDFRERAEFFYATNMLY